MLKISYLISSLFKYDELISGDAGRAFAEDYKIPVVTLTRLQDNSNDSNDIVVVDHRFLPAEIDELREHFVNSKTVFVLRLCDPYWEYGRDHWWSRLVSELLDQPRIHVMLNYQPAEISALFFARARRSKFILAPYVYRPEHEAPIDHGNRKHALLLSGAQDQRIYPLRAEIRRAATFWPPLALMTRTLPHPGYLDIGQTRREGAAIGQAYIDRLKHFRFAAVCSSRCRLEFLKYREFAYAGVVPVGDMPATLIDCPQDAWVSWRRNIVALSHKLKTMSDTAARAENFRRFMKARRDVTDMQRWLNHQLESLG